MERTEFIPILNLAVVSAFSEVDDICLYNYDTLHVYFHDQSFREIDITGRSNADLLALISSDLWVYHPSLIRDVKAVETKVTNFCVEFEGKQFTDIRLHEHEGEDVLVALYDGFLWVWKWNRMVITAIGLE